MEKFSEFGDVAYEIENKILEILKDDNVNGVAGPEIGINYQVIGFKRVKAPNLVVAFNPKIVHTSDEKAVYYDICYSYPGLIVKMTRPVSIRLRYQNVNGLVITESLMGYDALRVQHEIRHLETDKPFFHDANFIHKMKAIKDWKVITRRRKKLND